MARDFQVFGETIVKVKGGAHMRTVDQFQEPLPGQIGFLTELGLSSDPITVTPKFHHSDIITDDFGPTVPTEVQWHLAECNVRMTLVHYDDDALKACVKESMAGGTEGMMQGAGSLMGNFRPPQASGCHYMTIVLESSLFSSGLNTLYWRFPTAYLSEPPMSLPLGTEKSMTVLNWRAIPYSLSGGFINLAEMTSPGRILWDHRPEKSG